MDILGIDPIEHHVRIGVGMLVVMWLGAAVICGIYELNPNIAWGWAMQIVFMPVMAWVIWWCYAHPERVAAHPDGWMYDVRILSVMWVGLEVLIICLFNAGKFGPGPKALHWMKEANRLLAEGKIQEADAAYLKGQQLLARAKRRW
jgi:hypothetical protein